MLNTISVYCLKNQDASLDFYEILGGAKIQTSFGKLCEYGAKFVFKDNNGIPDKTKLTFFGRVVEKDSKKEKINDMKVRRFELKPDGRLWFSFNEPTDIVFNFSEEPEFVLNFLGNPHLKNDSVWLDLVCVSEIL